MTTLFIGVCKYNQYWLVYSQLKRISSSSMPSEGRSSLELQDEDKPPAPPVRMTSAKLATITFTSSLSLKVL